MVPCPRFEIRRKRNWRGKMLYRVVLIADNCEPLNVSEHLNSEVAAMNNIEAVKRIAPTAEVHRDF